MGTALLLWDVAAISSCDKAQQWEHALHLFTSLGQMANVISHINTIISTCERGLQWILALHALATGHQLPEAHVIQRAEKSLVSFCIHEVLAVIFDCYGKIRSGITEKALKKMKRIKRKKGKRRRKCLKSIEKYIGYALDDDAPAIYGLALHEPVVCKRGPPHGHQELQVRLHHARRQHVFH